MLSRGADNTVESEIHFIDEKTGAQLCLKYKGPGDTFERVALKLLGKKESLDESPE